MILYNGQLKILYDMVCRKEHLKLKYEELLEQKSLLKKEVDKLQKLSIKEQADVEKLECGSLATFFLNVVGKMDEKINKEKEEAYAAAVKYDAVKKELEKVEAELVAKEEEMAKLHGCEEEYEELLTLKKERMKTMTESEDGFVISEKDLKLRGPGEFFGIRQHGLPELKIADLYKDMAILKEAQEAAGKLLKTDRFLEREEHQLLKEHISGYLEGKTLEI